MKIRTDFVTNSSSSSFILAFKDINTIEEEIRDGFPDYYSEKVIDRVVKDSKEAAIMNKAQVTQALTKYFADEVEWNIFYHLSTEQYHLYRQTDKYIEEINKKVNEKLEDLKSYINNNEAFIEIEYEDHTELGSLLEHDIMPAHRSTMYIKNNH